MRKSVRIVAGKYAYVSKKARTRKVRAAGKKACKVA